MDYPRHIVAAGALITKGETVLLVKTPRRGWEIPDGQIEENESVLQGVRREVMEESNIRAKITALAGVYSNLADPCKVIFDFIGEWESGETATSDEMLEVEWVRRSLVLERVSHPVYRDRIEHLLSFEGNVVYKAYTNLDDYLILEKEDV